ncbi:MAG: hypothetical protein QG670_1758 [Thermoproteota archaeon]|nr:hypothetical protein [Thermoproteota archaeon]
MGNGGVMTSSRMSDPYMIIQCYSCGELLLAKGGQKTKLCTYCNTNLNLLRVRILARAPTARAASRIVIALKDMKK